MTQVKKFWPILTGTHRYEKTLSTRAHGEGIIITAPILSYLIETAHGRILYDTGCDYSKIVDDVKRRHFYEHEGFPFGPPTMEEEQRLPNRLAELGLKKEDVDVVFWDERLSTEEASEIMSAGGGRGQRVDAVAAAVILQSYLDRQA